LENSGITRFGYLTKERATALLMAWLDFYAPKYNLDYSLRCTKCITSGLERVYLEGLIRTLIDRVNAGSEDPVTEIAMYYYEMGEAIDRSSSDALVLHRFAGYMEQAAHSVLSYMQKMEKELYKNGI